MSSLFDAKFWTALSASEYFPIACSIVVVVLVRMLASRLAARFTGDAVALARGRVRVVALAIYPVKSCAGVAMQQWKLGKRGFIDDRHWMVVDAAGRFVSQRENPKLALVQPSYSDDFKTLILAAPACPLPLRVDRSRQPSGTAVPVTLWDDALTAREESSAANAWFAQAIAQPGVRLVRIASEHTRAMDARHAAGPTANGAVAFPDAAPFLLLSKQSLEELGNRLPESRKRCSDLRRFRPNIIVDGASRAHEEDSWGRIAIGNGPEPVILHATKQCTRCRLTTCDPDAGTIGADGEEPLSTLRRYRAPVTDDGGRSLIPLFGLHFLHDWSAAMGKTIAVGDAVEPLTSRTPEQLAPVKTANNNK
jgi:uncharacterized protein